MVAQQRILRVRRDYNQWVADQTLEDYALRFTAKSARRWSLFRVANTAIGGISFLALEAIGGAITLTYGFTNAMAAIAVVCSIIFLLGLPICHYAARYGVDIDLLTRGAGFGYLGSTITSLIYASFTFIFFALEAAIMTTALHLAFGIPEAIGLVISSLIVIPLVMHGFTFISRFHLWTQPLWIVLHAIPVLYFLLVENSAMQQWTSFTGRMGRVDGGFDIMLFGAASGVIFALVTQIGEQVDFLRFLPDYSKKGSRFAWYAALVSTGPGWIILGGVKLTAGSFLAFLAFKEGVPPADAAEPTHMYQVAYMRILNDPHLALMVTAVFVIVSQIKINVTNAYAGSIAWSNFFSRLTHSHPGRVVWVVFNVMIALLLMELGIYRSLEKILGLYAHVAVAWVGTIVADLIINKPLGISPRGIEFKRAYLYDINPVGVGAMVIASIISIAAHQGLFGPLAAALSCFIGLLFAMIASPAIAWMTKGRYYLARKEEPTRVAKPLKSTCCICENIFEAEDIAHCPAYNGPICSLCCTLDARCDDMCKTNSRFNEQIQIFKGQKSNNQPYSHGFSSLLRYIGLLGLVSGTMATVLWLVYYQSLSDAASATLGIGLLKAFLGLFLVAGIAAWLFVLAHESRKVAQEESFRQTHLLMQEIEAHEKTDLALQRAKEIAEAANLAKSRYLVGISHEFRTPLNSILGYAQLLDRKELPQERHESAIVTIRRSSEHLAGLVDGLLDIAKIEAGRMQLSSDIIDFPELLDQITDMFRLQAISKGIAFEFEKHSRLPQRVKTDEKRLRQILINLLSNAVKFTDQGFVRISLRWRHGVAEFTVEDTGIGIADADMERIFMPFERIDNPSGPWVPGTGLGLTITKLMTEVMGGEISLTSEVGRGSRFVVRLHIPSVAGKAAPGQHSGRITGYEGARRTVVVVDDQPSHLMLISDILTPLGFRVIQAENGTDCMAIVRKERPDLVLLDVTMPGLSGWDVAHLLREDCVYSGALIMMSAAAGADKRPNTAMSYHDGFIVKPVDIDVLLNEMARACQIQWTQSTSPLPQDRSDPQLDKMTLPPAKTVQELLALANIGYLSGMRTRLSELLTAQPEARDFFNHLSSLLSSMQIDTLCATLEAANHDINSANDA